MCKSEHLFGARSQFWILRISVFVALLLFIESDLITWPPLGGALHSNVWASSPLPLLKDSSLVPFRFHAPNRIVAIGDLHGDAEAMRKALRLAKAIDKNDHWIGKDLVVVQTGDQIDRWHQDREVLDFMTHLATEAEAAGGRVISLLGNHEIFNVQQIFSFVTPRSFKEFLDFPVPTHHPVSRDMKLSEPGPWGLPGVIVHPTDPGVINRAYAFEPGSPYAKLLSARPLFAIVNDSLFVHGGITLQDLKTGLPEISLDIQRWMSDESKGTREPQFPEMAQRRDLSEGTPSSEACGDLTGVLTALGLKRMVVGHSIQSDGINSACIEKVWRIDVMLSRGYRNYVQQAPRFEILEINGDRVSVLNNKASGNKKGEKRKQENGRNGTIKRPRNS